MGRSWQSAETSDVRIQMSEFRGHGGLLCPVVDARDLSMDTAGASLRAPGGLHWSPSATNFERGPMKNPPKGYHSVTPAIVVRDAAKAIDFYKEAFGAEELFRKARPDGTIMHAEIRIGDSLVMLGEENPVWQTKSPLTLGGVHGSLHIYVDDADGAFARAVAAGCEVRYPLEDAFWGDRYGKVSDPFGHEWGLATRVKDLSPEEMRKAAEAWAQQAMAGS